MNVLIRLFLLEPSVWGHNVCLGFLLGTTVKVVLRGHSKRRPKKVYKADYRLMQVKSIAECSKGSVLQYFRTSSSYHLVIKIFVLSIFEWQLMTGLTVYIQNLSTFAIHVHDVYCLPFAKACPSSMPDISPLRSLSILHDKQKWYTVLKHFSSAKITCSSSRPVPW